MTSDRESPAEDRVRAALQSLAREANADPTRPLAAQGPRTQAPRSRVRYPLVAAAAAVVGIVGVGLLLRDAPEDVTVVPAITTTSQSPTSAPTSTPPSSPDDTETKWVSMAEAPIEGRIGAGVVWTGDEILVWGGVTRNGTPSEVSDGAAYDPTTDTWRTIAPAPDGLIGGPGIATAWTGDVAVFWAGNSPDGVAAGATYDPVADTWQSFGPGPLGPREGFTSAWTGSELVIIGGVGGDQVATPVGAAFDPATRTWRSLPALNDHSGDLGSGIWTGDEILRSGQRLLCPELGSACADSEPFLAGYDPETDTYRDIDFGPPRPPADTALTLVGMASTELFFRSVDDPAAGLISYDTTAGTWTPTEPARCAIVDVSYSQAVWFEGRWMIPCGSDQLQIYDTGDRTWTVIDAGESPLNNRSGSQTIWTGTQLIMWSGAERAPGTPTPDDGFIIDLSGINQLIDSLPSSGPPSLDNETLGLRGIGPIQIGASLTELDALGYEITYSDCEVPFIQFGTDSLAGIVKGSDSVTGLYFWFERGNTDLRTDSGIGTGSTRADVLAAYGDRAVERSVEIEDYDPDVTTLEDRIELTPNDPADQGLVMIFSFFEDDTLSGIRTGEASAVDEPNLCA